ncbi:hypothetical protein K458DRAFT_31504 [Lentithecium fluviatile CBS 122367]|uniref:Uncharacterized protein n=1 Tax=Lentithecium fluviatile CBS 122367 TaxID=1168545 RepID=A0A6G1J1L5_9PLEO|nr:hypothetical protein K458DRAFT_31504 [Lentithecium fluviatile CBS 122367]
MAERRPPPSPVESWNRGIVESWNPFAVTGNGHLQSLPPVLPHMCSERRPARGARPPPADHLFAAWVPLGALADETSPSQAGGPCAAVSSRPLPQCQCPHRASCRGQCSCVAARERDARQHLSPANPQGPVASVPVQGMRSAAWARDISRSTLSSPPGPWRKSSFPDFGDIDAPLWEMVAAAARQCYRGARERRGLSRAIPITALGLNLDPSPRRER